MTPDEYTNQELMLDVGDGHQLYVQDWGNGAAKPILVLHGGPGNGVSDRDKQKYDPKKQRVIFHDQRGAGKSTPTLSLHHNTTQDLVADIEKIAQHLQLDTFVLTGGSWGSCLALAYGIAHPERVDGMVLNGIFTGNQDEIDWLERGGYRDFFPEVWQQYLSSVPQAQREAPSAYHFERAFGEDAEAAKQSAYAYERMELALLKLDDQYSPGPYEMYQPGAILMEMHYISNGCFMPDNFILDNAPKLTMPIWLVQGRYDMVCRPLAAHRLHEALPNSHLIWTINGHLGQHESNAIQQLLGLFVTGVK